VAFPTDAARVATNGSTAATNKVCNLPTGISSGDLLILILRSAASDTHSTPSGWTALALNDGADAADDITSVFYRVASGTEGSTVTVNGTASVKFAAVCWRITGGGTPQLSSIATGSSTAPNSPSFTPSGGAQDYLWVSLIGFAGTGSVSSGPASYLNVTSANSGFGSTTASNCRVAGATRQLNAATEDPGAWTISASAAWSAWTLAVPPGGTTSTPDTLALALTTYAPTVAIALTATPATLALTLTTYAPTAAIALTATPDTVALALTTYAPTVTTGVRVTPDTVALALTTYAPTVTTGVRVTPDTLALALTTYAPTVAIGVRVTPDTLALALTEYAPTVIITAPYLRRFLASYTPTASYYAAVMPVARLRAASTPVAGLRASYSAVATFRASYTPTATFLAGRF
jgi:ribosomal protein S19